MPHSSEKRSVGSSDADRFPLYSKKKAKQQQSSKSGSYFEVPLGDPRHKSKSKAHGTNESSSNGQENVGSSGKRKHGGWNATPSFFRSQKLHKTLYIPVEKYPGYNFVGLILGPRGRNQQRMETETGARIIVKGKGSKRMVKPHVLVEADSQKSLDAAVARVEKLLVPPEDGEDEVKLSQLRELAELNNTLRVKDTRKTVTTVSKTNGACDVRGDCEHYTVACTLTAQLPENRKDGNNYLCKTCGDPGHQTVACSFSGKLVQPETHENATNLLAAHQGGFSPFAGPPHLGNQPLGFRPAVNYVPLGSDKFPGDVDYTNLYVTHLPQYVDVNMLVQLFYPFGALSDAQVIRDKTTGLSEGYGFVKYIDPVSAATAVNQMNGYRIGGNVLVVRVAGNEHGTLGSVKPVEHSSIGFPSAYQNYSSISHIRAPPGWPGPPRSLLRGTSDLLYTSYRSSYTSPLPSSPVPAHATTGELAWFPGNPDNFVCSRTSLFS